MIKNFIIEIRNILRYYDPQPLLLFWCFSDILNNQILWTDYQYWSDLGQPNTYFLYCAYFIVSVGIFFSLNSLRWCIRFVSLYVLLYLFSTILYLVDLHGSNDFVFDIQAVRALTITFFYLLMWVWIWVKLKSEMLYRKLKK